MFYQSNNVITPNFSSYIIKRRGEGRDYGIRYGQFEDGCHVSFNITEKMKRELEHVTSVNRNKTVLIKSLLIR